MKMNVPFQSQPICLSRYSKIGVLLATALGVVACGALSNPERNETPSRLMIEAQAEYDAGNYSKAIELLEKLNEKDPSNEEGRIRLTFAYNAKLGITPIEFIKTVTSSGGSSGGSDVSKLTGKSSLPDDRVSALKAKSSSLTTAAALREAFPEFATFQKAFLTICPLFSKATMTALKTKAASALEILEVSKCGDGRDSANANVSIAALSVALGQFSSLYKAILDADGNGKFDLEEKASSAKASIDSLNSGAGANVTANLATLTTATRTLTDVGAQLKGEVFKLAIAQFSIIDAVIGGTNLPTEVKSGITKGVDGLNTALATVNSYLDAGKSTGNTASTGTATAQAAETAKQKADQLLGQLNPVTDAAKIEAYCKDIFCFNTVYGTSQKPTNCASYQFTASQCTTTPTTP